MKVVIDGSVQEAKAGELLIDLINPTRRIGFACLLSPTTRAGSDV